MLKFLRRDGTGYSMGTGEAALGQSGTAMRICQVDLHNFRGVKKGVVVLPKHAVLLGPNNTGKTTIVEALALLFGRERMIRPITDWDFFGGDPTPESRFRIIATITEFGTNEPEEVPAWFIGENAARPVWWDETLGQLSEAAEPPAGTALSAQVALCARFEAESCEFEIARYFYYGAGDPFTDGYTSVPTAILRDVGFFLLSANRDWDRLLSFNSSSLLKVIREYDALPAELIQELKHQLRDETAKIENGGALSEILKAAAKELRAFLLIEKQGAIAYRPTSLDTFAVLQSLVAHIIQPDGTLLPIARHGAGMVSLQAFLLLLAFAEQRKKSGRNFILGAEEPELHLHPSLHQRLVHRIRGESAQSIVTTQSPHVASGYRPQEVVFVQNNKGEVTARRLRTGPINDLPKNSLRNLYLTYRTQFFEALMGGIVLIPEGARDVGWLTLWQRVAQSSPELAAKHDLVPISVVPTISAAVFDTFQEVAKFRPDAIPLLDGDADGSSYLAQLATGDPRPRRVVRLGQKAAIECLSAWILEPALACPGAELQNLLSTASDRTLKGLQSALIEYKGNTDLHERLAWEATGNEESCSRACQFVSDIASIARGDSLSATWESTIKDGIEVLTATHIARA